MLDFKQASQLFTSKRIAEISSGEYSFFLKVAELYSHKLRKNFTIEDVFGLCYEDLSKKYRGEYFFKNTVAKKILFGIHSPNTATIIPEFRVGRSKADCVVLNGHSTCYEIKSPYDNLDRLPAQLSQYQKIFDKTYVITCTEHVEKVLSSANDDIGVMVLTKRNQLSKIKDARLSNAPIDVSTLMKSLRVHEFTEIVRSIHGKAPDVNNTEIYSACEKTLIASPPELIREQFCRVLKESRKIKKGFIEQLPSSLLMAGISYKLTSQQKKHLLANLNKSFSREDLCTIQYSEESSSN